MNPPNRAKTLTQAWQACVQAGHALTPGKFLVLCDLLAHPDASSANQRAKRLRMSQPLVSDAQRTLAAVGLATITRVPPALGGIQDATHARPTRAAIALFNMRPGRNTSGQKREA